MINLNQVQENIRELSKCSRYFSLKKTDFPEFALFLRKTYIDSPKMQQSITNEQRSILNRYERALALYWNAFPPELQKHPLIKDLAFFFTCLFDVKMNRDQEALLTIWGLTATQMPSLYSQLEYYAPGDYRSLLAPRTKTQRLRMAKYILNLFTQAIIFVNTQELQINGPDMDISLNFNQFLENFHRYTFMAPKVLSENDICLLTKIIQIQSDNQQVLGEYCNLNKNTVSTRLRWFMGNHILFQRQRVAYDAFGLIPYVLLIHSENKRLDLSHEEKLNPWLLSEYLGTENQQIFYLLIPDTNEGKRYLKVLINESIQPFIKDFFILQRVLNHEFFIYNINTYNHIHQKWTFSSLSSLHKTSPIFPFANKCFESYRPSRSQMRILNYYKTYPTATRRQACEDLRIGTSTLTQELKILNKHHVIKPFIGIYPFDLPEFASFFLCIDSNEDFDSFIDDLTQGIPIIQGGGFKGDFYGIYLNIPFPSTQDIVRFHTALHNNGENIVWFQVNDHPFASRWLFPLDLWDDSTGTWLLEQTG